MKHVGRIVILTLTLALSGCATTTNPRDPFEPFNRAMFELNDTIDRTALKPSAEVYRDVTPGFVQTGVSNFFGNLGDVWTAINNLLQGRVENGMSDIMRVSINTVLGFGGILDIASEGGLPKHRADFGQTLGKWGVESGPYVVLPFFGSSTVRDSIATPVDLLGDPWGYKDPVRWRNTGRVVRLVDRRATLLDASNLLEEAALDRYEFVRDAYLQRRRSQIRSDGASPRSSYEDEALDEQGEAAEPGGKPVVESEKAGDGMMSSFAASAAK